MNPLYRLIAEVVGGLLVAITIGTVAYHSGHTNGVNGQKVADQVEFDKVNKELANQKVTANAILQKALEDNLKDVNEYEHKMHALQEQHLQDVAATDAIHDKYATVGLRIRAPENSGCRSSGQNPGPAAPSTASAPSSATVELPGEVTANLRRLVKDADILKDNYAVCYRYVNQPEVGVVRQ